MTLKLPSPAPSHQHLLTSHRGMHLVFCSMLSCCHPFRHLRPNTIRACHGEPMQQLTFIPQPVAAFLCPQHTYLNRTPQRPQRGALYRSCRGQSAVDTLCRAYSIVIATHSFAIRPDRIDCVKLQLFHGPELLQQGRVTTNRLRLEMACGTSFLISVAERAS